MVTIKTPLGEYVDRVNFPKGEKVNPLTDDEFRNRYDGLMAYAGVPFAVSGEVFDAVYRPNAKAEALVKVL